MKQKVTKARKANTRYYKGFGSGIYNLSVAERRKMNILGPDHAEYDEKHGIGIGIAGGGRKRTFLGLFARKSQRA